MCSVKTSAAQGHFIESEMSTSDMVAKLRAVHYTA